MSSLEIMSRLFVEDEKMSRLNTLEGEDVPELNALEDEEMPELNALEDEMPRLNALKDEEMPGSSVKGKNMSPLSLELARLTGRTEVRQEDLWLSDDNSGYRVRFLDAFELDRLQYVRFTPNISGSLALEIIKCHCQLANRSESFYTSISAEEWLWTVVTTEKPSMIFCGEQGQKKRYLNEKAGVKIQSNVVSRQAYLKRLATVSEEVGACQELDHQCARGFFPISDLPAEGEFDCPFYSCTDCAFAKQLNTAPDCIRSELSKAFWYLEKEDVEEGYAIGEGSGGIVSTIFWRNGTFARKRFWMGAMFNRELDVALTVSHPNIIHCFGYSSRAGSAHSDPAFDMFMEVLDEDLEGFLDRPEDHETFPYREALEMVLQVAEAVEHLHCMNITHGDLKPGNILLRKLAMHSDVPFYLVKVADFGCAHRVNSSGAAVDVVDLRIGTNPYLAPEVLSCRMIESEIRKIERKIKVPQLDRQKVEDHKSSKAGLEEDLKEKLQKINFQKVDVYSFGVIMYQLLISRDRNVYPEDFRDFRSEVINGNLRPDHNLHLYSADLPENWLKIFLPFIQSCWKENPADRPCFTNPTTHKQRDCIVDIFKSLTRKWDVFLCGTKGSRRQVPYCGEPQG